MRILNADGFTLEPLTQMHAELMFAVLNDPAIYEFENASPASLEWLRARYARLEARVSPDGNEQWLNWVVKRPSGELLGYVQATVRRDGSALIAYELASAHWRQGVGSRAVSTMIAELNAQYNTQQCWAILKQKNERSRRLLDRLLFTAATPAQAEAMGVEADEILMGRAYSFVKPV
jgi:[ribosomal protein S5]-alanine N-acetyltransferase